jgi:glycerol-1-phosphate dehydrogenase [NAD(P)+]
LPSPEDVAAMLASVDAPTRPSEINISEDILIDSIIYARDRKKIYTVMQLLGDLGCLRDFADRVNSFFATKALSGIKCFVLDMDGTIYLGDKLFPYTLEFLSCLKKSGKDYIFYTNNSSQNSAYYISKLHKMGIPVSADKLYMSTHVLLEYLKRTERTTGKSVFVAGTRALKDDFEAAGYILTEDDPDFVVLGFDTDMDYKRLTKLCDFVRAGLPYFGVHTDYNCPVEGGFIPDCGSLAAAVTAATGITPEFYGKPSRHTLDYIIGKTGYKEHELCFIGDRLYTDIAIAADTSARSVLVLSGETKRNSLVGSRYVPDLIVKDLTELAEYV